MPGRAGTITSPRHRTPDAGVRAGTIRNELGLLVTMLKWARAHRVGGRPLLTGDPLEGVRLPAETNARRPAPRRTRSTHVGASGCSSCLRATPAGVSMRW